MTTNQPQDTIAPTRFRTILAHPPRGIGQKDGRAGAITHIDRIAPSRISQRSLAGRNGQDAVIERRAGGPCQDRFAPRRGPGPFLSEHEIPTDIAILGYPVPRDAQLHGGSSS